MHISKPAMTLIVIITTLPGCDGDASLREEPLMSEWSNGYRLEKIVTSDNTDTILQTKEFSYSEDGTTVRLSHIERPFYEQSDPSTIWGTTANVAFVGGCYGTVDINDIGMIVQAETDQPGCTLQAESATEIRYSSDSSKYLIDPLLHRLSQSSEYTCTKTYSYSADNTIENIANDGTEAWCGYSVDSISYNELGHTQKIDRYPMGQSRPYITEIYRDSHQAFGNVTRFDPSDPDGTEKWFVVWNGDSTQILSVETAPSSTESAKRNEITYDTYGNPIAATILVDGYVSSKVEFFYTRSDKPVANIGLTLVAESVLLSGL